MISATILNKSDQYIETIGFIVANEITISTDTRTIKSGDIFIGLDGENFKGFDFVSKALEKGAAGVVLNDSPKNRETAKKLYENNKKAFFIIVKDTLKYLQDIASHHRQSLKTKIIGITGSNGKTTTKEMLIHFMRAVVGNKVFATKGNLNNHIGVPLTLLELSDEYEFAIVEMGTNFPGEIEFLCELARPEMGMITNVGYAHIEFLKDLDGVLKEKSALYYSVMKETGSKGLYILNTLDEKLNTLAREENVIEFGKNISFKDGSVTVDGINLVNDNIVGEHNFTNLAMTFTFAKELFKNDIETLVKAAGTFEPKSNRSSWVEYGTIKVFLDAYNANPSSMEAALEGFAQYLESQKIDLAKATIAIGDMNELGDQSENLHEAIGESLNRLGFKKALFVGRFADCYAESFEGESSIFTSVKEVSPEFWNQWIKNTNYLFVKGSRSLQMESLLDIN